MCNHKPSSTYIILALFITLLSTQFTSGQNSTEDNGTRSKFKAAVYAHAVIIPTDETPVTRKKALENMEKNLAVYRQQVAEAKRQGVELIVFPEDGVYGMRFKRDTLYPYLEYIPDPATETWNPCVEPDRYPNSDVQIALSCMARENNLYLVANMGDKQPCDPRTDPKCPKDKRYQYNTDVAYGPDGTFLARYHKRHLFFEEQFDTPTPEHIYFDTPFGRFGMMTCFDVLFKEPGIPLVENFNVTNIAFPTGWMDALPLLPAIGFHSSFARAHDVNFLSANLHLPEINFDGTGLYGPDGAHGVYYGSGTTALLPKLVVADMDVIQAPKDTKEKPLNTPPLSDSVIISSLNMTFLQKESSPSDEFDAILFADTYTFRTLEKASDNIKVCQGKVCCYLEYSLSNDRFEEGELFAFGAFDGLHTKDGSYYMQNCVMVKCPNATNRSSCGTQTTISETPFSKIVLHGDLETKYIYPHILLSDTHGQLDISPPGEWAFADSTIRTMDSFDSTVLNVILIGREYNRDNDPADFGGVGDNGSQLVQSLVVIVLCLGGIVVLYNMPSDLF